MIEPGDVPSWDSIPPVPGQPVGTAWSVWGEGDQLGALNMLTPANMLSALKEVRVGKRFQLDWSMDKPKFPSPGRIELAHKVICATGPEWYGCDDEIHINTQSSSQWDGFKHCAHPSGVLYGGFPLSSVKDAKDTMRNGIHHWVDSGGIAGRGVLLDWARWYEHKTSSPLPKACTPHAIPVSELDEVAKFQGTTLRPGDILFVRFGFTKWYDAASDDERRIAFRENGGKWIGVHADLETKKWIWNHHFAAVVGDTLAFEVCGAGTISLHHWLLPLAGIPIGEMFYLEKLAEACETEKQWTFFFTSAPLNVPGGVASSPNGIAFL